MSKATKTATKPSTASTKGATAMTNTNTTTATTATTATLAIHEAAYMLSDTQADFRRLVAVARSLLKGEPTITADLAHAVVADISHGDVEAQDTAKGTYYRVVNHGLSMTEVIVYLRRVLAVDDCDLYAQLPGDVGKVAVKTVDQEGKPVAKRGKAKAKPVKAAPAVELDTAKLTGFQGAFEVMAALPVGTQVILTAAKSDQTYIRVHQGTGSARREYAVDNTKRAPDSDAYLVSQLKGQDNDYVTVVKESFEAGRVQRIARVLVAGEKSWDTLKKSDLTFIAQDGIRAKIEAFMKVLAPKATK